jgi:membrane protease subunit HflC
MEIYKKGKVMHKKIVLGIFALVIAIIGFSSVFVVDQREQALVLQFGKPVAVVSDAGLYVKTPFIQNVLRFDKRLLDLTASDKEVIASDQKRLIINAFAKYRIVDPLKYYTTVRNEYGMKSKLNTILDSSLRQVIGEIPLNTLLSEKRTEIMTQILGVVNERVAEFGIVIADVRIMRTDLPEENSNAIYKRMQTEREREAKEIRAEGEEESQKIKAGADREKVVLLADAKKTAEILKGEGDSISLKVSARAYNRNPEFYAFYRSMEVYKNSLSKDTKMVLSPNSELLKYMTRGTNVGSETTNKKKRK